MIKVRSIVASLIYLLSFCQAQQLQDLSMQATNSYRRRPMTYPAHANLRGSHAKENTAEKLSAEWTRQRRESLLPGGTRTAQVVNAICKASRRAHLPEFNDVLPAESAVPDVSLRFCVAHGSFLFYFGSLLFLFRCYATTTAKH